MPDADDEWFAEYQPVATVVHARLDAAHRPLVVGVGGAVASGKSTAAQALHHLLDDLTVEVVSTDGFLCPNRVLAERGLIMRKGFPETFDTVALRAFLAALRGGAPQAEAPVYSHGTYDIVRGSRHVVTHPDVLILEGVIALSSGLDGLVDIGVYIDADEVDLRRWFATRFATLARGAKNGEFFAQWRDLEPDALTDLADQVWTGINGVNLRDHILPTRDRADVIVRKGPDHRVREVNTDLRRGG